MTEEEISREDAIVAKRPLWLRILKWVAIAVVGPIVLASVVVLGLNTAPGRRIIANSIGGYTTASGLNIKVGRIEGSLYGKMALVDVRVSDPKGVFLTSPRIAVDWRPFDYLNNHIDVRSAQAAVVSMSRSPVFKPTPTDPNASILPDLDIDIGRLTIDRMVLAKAVTGAAHVLTIDGATHIADKRAQISAKVAALTGSGIAGGDRLKFKLDAVPDKDLLDIDTHLTAPGNGVVAMMSGLKAPVDFTIGGTGSWKAWSGKAVGTLGGAPLADLTLTANSGHFTVRGTTSPGLYPGGAPKDKASQANPIARLTAPALNIAADAVLDQRKVTLNAAVKSDALALDAKGLIDLAASSFSQFTVNARLLTPGAILPNLNGRDVTARVVLDGKFATPKVNYVVSAGVLGFGETQVQQLYASGLATVNADHILIPVQARAARVTGMNAAAGGLLDNVTIGGDFAIAKGKVLSDNLKIRSSKIDATAIVVADLATGLYRGALNGRVNDYKVQGFGVVSLRTDAKLVTVPSGGFGLTAHVAAKTSQIFNEGARNFLGGNAVVAADVGYDPNGIVTFRNLHLNAPQFRVTRGQGRYDPRGPLLVDADAYSTQYGPLFARVSGTVNKPVVLLRAPRPGVGVGLVNLEARVQGTGKAYAVQAKGGTNYGPFTADLLVAPAAPLTVDIRGARFAGVDFKGRVQQLAAGPFGGRVTFAGSGISGAALLAAQGKVQRVDVAARASNAKIPGMVDFSIGRAIVNAQAILYPNAPQVVADAQVADLRYGVTVLSSARAKVDYVNGSGTGQAVATGSNGVPFNVAANAKLSPKLWLLALQGQANGIDFKTGTPARIEIDRGTYRLQPTRLDFGAGKTGGSARVAGEYGSAISAKLRLDALDLSVANALVPDLGLGGAATGSLDYTQPHGASVPQIAGMFRVKNFTRSSLTNVSTPVDIIAQIGLNEAGGDARALIQQGNTTIGRLVATLKPLGAGTGWNERLMAAPLSGGIRYNGPSAALFSFAGMARQQLSGPIAIAADFAGRVDAPQLNGLIRADSLTYDNETYGTRLTQMKIAGRFTNDRLEITQLSAKAGDGTVQAQGSVGISAAAGFPIDIRAKLDNARLAKSDALGATATGTIAVTNSKAAGGLISGEIVIPNARYEIIRQGQAEVAELTGIRRKGDILKAFTQTESAVPPVGLFKLDLHVKADNQLFVSGMGLESEWQMDMRVSGTSNDPRVTGNLQIIRGTYSFAGKRFDVTKGTVRFDGGPLTDPEIDLSATTSTNDVTVVINVAGTGQKPQISFSSTPALPQDEVLSRLLFGSSVTNLSAIQAIQLAAALNSLRGSGGGLNPLGKLRTVAGIDRLRVLGADEASGRSTALAAGKYITNNIYVEIITDARGFTATQLEVSLTKALSVLSQAGSFGGSNVTVRYKRDF